MLLLLVLNVGGKNDAEQWCLALSRLQIENIVLIWMVVQQVDQVSKDLVVAVMRRIMQHGPEKARLTHLLRQTVWALGRTTILALREEVLQLIQLALCADVVEDHLLLERMLHRNEFLATLVRQSLVITARCAEFYYWEAET